MNRLFAELRRRNVLRAGGVYVVAGWLIAQAAGILEDALVMPGWFDTVIVSALLLGLPVALILAWAFELTPDGVKRTVDVAEGESIAPQTGRRLDYAILAGIGLVAVLFVADRIMPEKPRSSFETHSASAPQDEGRGPPDAEELAAQGDGSVTKGPAPAASIAILPFADLSPAGDQTYFSDGVAEEILNVLARIDGLKVASRTSSFQFRNQTVGAPVIARELGVRHILEGSVRKAGETIRITAQLIDADADTHLWSETFDRPLTTETVFSIQDEIANAIVAELSRKMRIGAPAGDPVSRDADTQNLDAYELYLKGHSLFLARGKENLIEAIRALEQATRIDPAFARAFATLSAVYTVAQSWRILDRDYGALALDTADTALRLNPDLALPYAARGYATRTAVVSGTGSWEDSIANYGEALKRDPKDPTAVFWRGIEYHTLGYFDRAIADYEACLAIDPAYENCRRWMAKAFLSAGRTEEGLRLFELGLERGFFNQDNQFAGTYAMRGDRVAALAMLAETFSEYKPIISPIYRSLTDPTFTEADRQAALDVLKRMPDLALNEADPWFWFRAYDEIPVTDRGQTLIWWYRDDPAFIKSDARKNLIRAWKLPEYWREHGFPPQCKPVGEDDFECD